MTGKHTVTKAVILFAVNSGPLRLRSRPLFLSVQCTLTPTVTETIALVKTMHIDTGWPRLWVHLLSQQCRETNWDWEWDWICGYISHFNNPKRHTLNPRLWLFPLQQCTPAQADWDHDYISHYNSANRYRLWLRPWLHLPSQQCTQTHTDWDHDYSSHPNSALRHTVAEVVTISPVTTVHIDTDCHRDSYYFFRKTSARRPTLWLMLWLFLHNTSAHRHRL